MSIANRYNLSFHIWTFSDGVTIKPSIGVSSVNGESINHEIASFLEPNGIENIDSIIFDINALVFDGNPIDDVDVWGYHDSESVEIRKSPLGTAVAVFNTGAREVVVPVTDFLQILEEWRAFVASVPKPHWLENR